MIRSNQILLVVFVSLHCCDVVNWHSHHPHTNYQPQTGVAGYDVGARAALLKKIYEGLNPGGVLIISEKIHFEDPETQDHITKLHLDFKRENGYSELEIANKRQAIENVMITETTKTHIDRLRDCGFVETSCYFQCLNFVSFLSVK